MSVSIRLLGGFAIERDGVPILSHFPRRKGARLLAYVALLPGRGRLRLNIAATLWPDFEIEKQKDSLRNELAALRTLLHKTEAGLDNLLLIDKNEVRINRAVATTDFAQWCADLKLSLGKNGDADISQLRQLVSQGEAAGTLLPGWDADWITASRLEFETLLQRANLDLARACDAEGNEREARDCAQRAIVLDASTEVTQSAREFLRVLESPLPRPTAKANARSTRLTDNAESLRPRLAMTRFFGRRTEIERIDQGIRRAMLGETIEGSETLPLPPRLIAITGTGGVGKTRLALEIQERNSERVRCLFVPLVTALSANDIPRALATALGVTPEAEASLLTQLGRVLRVQPTLLILDNLEHLLPTERGAVEAIFQSLLESAPALVLLTTSRQRLEAPFEFEISLSTLPLPDISESEIKDEPSAAVEALQRCESVQLLEDRMRKAKPDFYVHARNASAVAALCRRLDGLPLALELVAARAGLATPSEILKELNTRFDLRAGSRQDLSPRDERHLTLWEAVDWSYRLLPTNLRTFFAWLSVFRGGFTLESAAAICSNGDQGDAAFALEALQARSFVVAEEDTVTESMRYRLLETLREFGAQQLSSEAQADLSRRHAEHFLAFSQEARRHETGSDSVHWLDRQQREYANVTAALNAFEKADEWLPVLRLIAAANYFWRRRGLAVYWADRSASLIERAERRFEQILPDAEQTDERLRCLTAAANGSARLYSQISNLKKYRYMTDKAIAWAKECGDPNEIAWARLCLGYLEMADGNYLAAYALYQEVVAIGHYDAAHAQALHSLGSLSIATGNYAQALTYYQDSLHVSRELQHKFLQALTLNAMGNLYKMQSQFDRAIEFALASLAIFEELGDPQGSELVKRVLADCYTHAGNFRQARHYISDVLPHAEMRADPEECALLVRMSGFIALKEGNIADAHRHLVRSLDLLTGIGANAQCSRALECVGHVAAGLGYATQAAHFWGAAAAWHSAHGVCDSPFEEALAAPYRDRARAALGDAGFDREFAVGRAMAWEDAVASARKLPAHPFDPVA